MKTVGWQKRQALTLASQLPDDPREALLILELTKNLVEQFLMDEDHQSTGHVGPPSNIPDNVVLFGTPGVAG